MSSREKPFGLIAALVGTTVIGPLSLTIFIPALPAIEKEFAVGVQLVQLNLSLPLLSVILVPPLVGVLADRIGRRMMTIGSLVVLLASSLLCVLAWNFSALLIGRTIVGVSGTCVLVVARAVIYDVYGAENLSRVMARYSVAPVIAILVAPLIGGAISDNYDWRGIFVCLFILAAVLIVMVMVWLPDIGTDREPRRSDAGVEMVTGRWTDLLGSPTFWGYATQSMFHFGTAFAFVAAGPYLMVNVLGYTASDFGIGMLVIVASMLAGVLSAERTTAFMSQPMHVVVGCLISVIGSGASALLLIGLGYPLTIYNLFAPTCIVAYGIGFAMPASQAGIVGDIPQCSATASGVSSCMQLLTAAVFAHLVTLSVYPSEMLLSITALIALVTAGAASLIPVRFARPPGY